METRISFLRSLKEDIEKNPKFWAKKLKKKPKNRLKVNEEFWVDIHPEIVRVSKSRFKSKHYADAVEAALKEINDKVKAIVKTKIGSEFDGADLMDKAFSLQNPILKFNDLSTESDKNIQKGYMRIFGGAMIGIRNPKSHANLDITALTAKHHLYLSSLLMNMLDNC